jgi:hypothetical protein
MFDYSVITAHINVLNTMEELLKEGNTWNELQYRKYSN